MHINDEALNGIENTGGVTTWFGSYSEVRRYDWWMSKSSLNRESHVKLPVACLAHFKPFLVHFPPF